MDKVPSVGLDFLWEQIFIVMNLLNRQVVQVQFLALGLSLLLAWLLTHHIKARFLLGSEKEAREARVGSFWQTYGVKALQLLLMPSLSLGFLLVSCLIFQELTWVWGFLRFSLNLVGAFWLYRLGLLFLYSFFPRELITSYRERLFAPLFFLWVGRSLLNLLGSLETLLQVEVLTLFDQPVSLGAILMVTVGSYLWVMGSTLIEKFLLYAWRFLLPQEFQGQPAIALLLRYFLIAMGFVIILGYVNFNPTALAAITGGLSVGIGFGLKEVFSNFISGIWLLIEGALKPGDYISIGGDMSEVKKLGIRATIVQVLRDNTEKIIPNQEFFTKEVTTFTGSDRLSYCSLTVGTSYEQDPEKIIAILLDIAQHHPNILQMPSPQVFFIGFGESSLNFELKFWLDNPLIQKRVTSQLGCTIWQVFQEKGIEIPYPQRDVHLR
ncbi:MAG: mechanosensitive ion channel family protein [Microcystaceae cyanobacterium]